MSIYYQTIVASFKKIKTIHIYANGYKLQDITDEQLKLFLPKTVEIAQKLAEKASYLVETNSTAQKQSRSKKSHFSFLNAIKAIFSKKSAGNDPLNPDCTKRIFKQIYDTTTTNKTAAGGAKPRKFFCASFVGYLLQAGEANAAWTRLNEKHTNIEKRIPEVDQPTTKKSVSRWAQRMAKEHGKELDNLMQHYRFDAKKTGPGALRSFFKQEKIHSFFLEGC